MAATDKIRFRCPRCDKSVSVSVRYAGKRGKCPGCSAIVQIPSVQQRPVRADPAIQAEVERLIATITAPCHGRSFGDPIELAQHRLSQMGQIAVPIVLEALPHYQGWELAYLIQPLSVIGDHQAVRPLLGLLGSGDKNVREAAVSALAKLGAVKAVEDFSRLATEDPDYGVRREAIIALGEFGEARGVDALLRVLRDPNPFLREAAAEALGRIGDSRAQAPLIAAAAHDKEDSVCKAARDALEQMGPAAVETLQRQLRGQSVPVNPEGNALFDLLHSGRKYSGDNPIFLNAPGASVYQGTDGRGCEHWYLCLPTGSHFLDKREIAIDPEKDPDRFVADAIKAAPGWQITLQADGSLYRLIKSGWVFDFLNPILIGDLAYLHFDERDNDWVLRVPVGDDTERSFPLSSITHVEPQMDEKVLQAIAAVGLNLMEERRG